MVLELFLKDQENRTVSFPNILVMDDSFGDGCPGWGAVITETSQSFVLLRSSVLVNVIESRGSMK